MNPSVGSYLSSYLVVAHALSVKDAYRLARIFLHRTRRYRTPRFEFYYQRYRRTHVDPLEERSLAAFDTFVATAKLQVVVDELWHVLDNWMTNVFVYRDAFPVLPPTMFYPPLQVVVLEEHPDLAVVPELKDAMRVSQWLALSDELVEAYQVAIDQWRREFDVEVTWSREFERLRDVYLREVTASWDWGKYKKTEHATVLFALREVEGVGNDILAEAFSLAKSTVQGHIRDIETTIGYKRKLFGGHRGGRHSQDRKDALKTLERRLAAYDARREQAQRLAQRWVPVRGYDLEAYEATAEPLRQIVAPPPDQALPFVPRLRAKGDEWA